MACFRLLAHSLLGELPKLHNRESKLALLNAFQLVSDFSDSRSVHRFVTGRWKRISKVLSDLRGIQCLGAIVLQIERNRCRQNTDD